MQTKHTRPFGPLTNLKLSLLLALLTCCVQWAQATPYATALTNNAGTISFRLNESADSVSVIYTNLSAGMETNTWGPQAAGLVVTNLGVPGAFSVTVSKSAVPGYLSGVALQISSDATNSVRFSSPRGVAVNQNPASPYFGRIYVANSADGTAGTRPTGDGIYVLNADYTDAVGQGDTALTAGITAFTNQDTTATSPWRLEVGEDDNLYIADFSPTNGTILVTDPDVSTGTNLLVGFGAPDSPTASTNHGRIGSSIFATGSLGTSDLIIYAIDTDNTNTTSGAGNHIMRWNIGSGPIPVDLTVTNVDETTLLPNAGITMDLAKGPDGKYYTMQNRSDGFEAGIFVVDPTVDADVDGLWDVTYDTLSDSIINFGESVDLIRQSRAVAISPDGKNMAIVRDAGDTWIIPLVNGIPQIAQRKLVPTGSVTLGRDIGFDAAGNLYAAISGHTAVRVFSPGYQSTATTTSDGTFSVTNIIPDNIVTVSGTITNAAEPGSNGEITFTRSGSDLSQPLTVNYTISGTATRGVDYNTNSISGTTNASVTFAAFATTVAVTIPVIDDSIGEPTETVIFTLTASTNYVIGNNLPATVFIADDGDLPSVSVASVGLGSYELLPGRPAKFRLSIPTANGVDIAINVGLTGTAVSGVDYVNPSSFSVTLLAGATSTNFTVTPVNNSVIAADKTIIASVLTGSGYTNSGTSTTATNILRNDDLPPKPTLFSDNFDVDSSASWTVNQSGAGSQALFAFDYSTYSIPVAPNTTNGTTIGAILRANISGTAAAQGIAMSPTALSLPSDYRLRFDLWMNYNGPLPGGGSGSSQHFIAGAGVSASRTNVAVSSSTSLPGSSVLFSTTGDGGFSATTTLPRDFNVHTNGVRIAASGTSIYPAGSQDNLSTYYAEFGELPAPAGQVTSFANQTGLGAIGALSFAWHDVVITKIGTNYTWDIDGLRIANVTYLPATIGSNFSIGHMDVTSGQSDVTTMNFSIVDNLRVESLTITPPLITSITLINSGTEVQIDFTAATTDVPGDFTLQSTGNIATTPLADVTATITSLGGGNFRAVRAVSGSEQFYRIKR